MDSKELAWNRYSMNIEMYQKFMDIVIKINLFYYGIIGALLSFYFTHVEKYPDIKFSLALPALFSIGLIALFIFGNKALAVTKADIDQTVQELEMTHFVRIDALIYLIRGSIFFFILTLIGLIFVYFS